MATPISVLVATIAAFAVGMVWYTALFGRRWRLLMEVSTRHLGAVPEVASSARGASMASALAGGFVATFVLVSALAYLMHALRIPDLAGALALGLLVSLGFIATVLANALWYERRPVELYLINAGHYVAALTVASLVLYYLS
jgi:hypothetical protein